MNMNTFNQGMYNLTHAYYNLPEQNTYINVTEIYSQVAQTFPDGILKLLLASIICFLLYYHILPIWFKYFNDTYNLQHATFVLGLSFVTIAALDLYYYSSENTTFFKLTYIALAFIIYIIIYLMVKYLISKKERMNKNGN